MAGKNGGHVLPDEEFPVYLGMFRTKDVEDGGDKVKLHTPKIWFTSHYAPGLNAFVPKSSIRLDEREAPDGSKCYGAYVKDEPLYVEFKAECRGDGTRGSAVRLNALDGVELISVDDNYYSFYRSLDEVDVRCTMTPDAFVAYVDEAREGEAEKAREKRREMWSKADDLRHELTRLSWSGSGDYRSRRRLEDEQRECIREARHADGERDFWSEANGDMSKAVEVREQRLQALLDEAQSWADGVDGAGSGGSYSIAD